MTFAKVFKKGDRIRFGDHVGTFIRLGRVSGEAIVSSATQLQMFTVPFDELRHAPVTVVGPTPMKPRTVCPQCGAGLTANDATKTDARELVRSQGGLWYSRPRTEVRVVACGFCDFLEEVKR